MSELVVTSEIRAVVDFVTRHPNITGGISFHTWSGVLLRPVVMWSVS